MILQENTKLIINLTKTKEHGKIKCDKYWPSEVGESLTFEESGQTIQIILKSSESLMENLIRRRLIIINQTENIELREVIQLNYLSWPDHGAPEPSDYLIIQKLIQYIEEYKCQNQQNEESLQRKFQQQEIHSKIVLHCSAGIGRTGTILAIYNIIESLNILLQLKGEMSAENIPRVSIFGVVRRLREQRYCMVQSPSQYEFIYEYMLDYLSQSNLIALKFPRNAFGLDDEQPEEELTRVQ